MSNWFLEDSWRKANLCYFGGFQAFLQKRKIVVIHPHIISGKDFGLWEFDGNICWFGGIGKLRHLEKANRFRKGSINAPIIRIQRLPKITGKDFGLWEFDGNIRWFDRIRNSDFWKSKLVQKRVDKSPQLIEYNVCL